MEIKVLGGAHEIGGNKIIVRSDNTSFWFDIGVKYGQKLELFEYGIVRRFSLERLVSQGLFPIKGIRESVKEENGLKNINVVLSHAHSDHYGLMTFYNAWEKTGISIRLFTSSDLFRLLKTRLQIGRLGKVLSYTDCRRIKDADIAGLSSLEKIPVDHSIDASYGYIASTSEGHVGYTGDLRFSDESIFQRTVEKFRDVDFLITEATRVASYNLLSENEVKLRFEKIMNRYWDSTIVVVVGWYTHTSRVRSIIDASGGRKVVLNQNIALLLEAADQSILKNPRVYVLKMRERDNIPQGAKTMSLQEVNDERGNVVVVIPEAQKLYLWREETPDSILVRPKDVVIGSLSEAYDEDSAEALLKLSNYVLRELKVPIYHIHASGHASLDQIADFINEAGPKEVYVIHSPVPEALKPLISDKIKIHMP